MSVALTAFDFNDLSPIIMPTILANSMGKMFLAAVCTHHEMFWDEIVVGAPSVAPAFGNLPLWKRRHRFTPLYLHKNACQRGRRKSL